MRLARYGGYGPLSVQREEPVGRSKWESVQRILNEGLLSPGNRRALTSRLGHAACTNERVLGILSWCMPLDMDSGI